MKKLLLPLIISFCILGESVAFSSDKVFDNSDAVALMNKAKEGGVTPELSELLSKLKKFNVKDAIYLPSGGLYLFEDDRKQLMAVTTDGRYSISGGSLVDVIKRTQLLSVEEVRNSFLISLDDAPFPLSTVASIPMGNPKLKRQAAIFLSLDGNDTQEIVKKFYDEREKYRIDLVLIPTPGEPKQELRRLWCSKEKGKINDLDILRWLMGNKTDIEKRLLSNNEAEACKADPLVASLALAGIYSLQGVPSVIRQDGLVSNGIPNDFDAWLKQSITPLFKNPFDTK